MSRWKLVAIIVGIAAFGAWAQTGKYKLGTAATPQQIRAFGTSISPSGKGLPRGEGTAQTGRRLYQDRCAACHGVKGEGGPGSPALAGGIGTLKSAEPLLTVGSFWPYPTTVYDYIDRAMPPQNPGSLTPDEVYAATAYVLHLNGLVKETEAMNAQTLPKVAMPNRNGFVPDNRPDVKRKHAGGKY